ncbi:type IV conjugative transfer system protein TraE [Pantoea agglomerans]|uniref:type IV conjugative transfer system protein TraE n=1 Tax=Enterobacter agglomerans TaxID=549 RepID=UPI001F4DBAAF|nr:type IV conjugative transfer system protein TraE [Pantoea agglomerans]MCH9408633.1 type IV conjugative transfer system protein TraE [Pantoea agglomerans]
MRLSTKKDTDKRTAIAFLVMAGMLGVSLLTNATETVLLWQARNTQERITVPMGFDKPFVSTNQGGDINLNSMLVRAMLSLRLDVTPETIDRQQKELLSYTSPDNRAELKRPLEVEADYIHKNDVSAQFRIGSFDYNPATGDTEVSGEQVAATSGGRLKLPDTTKHYIVNVSYVNGMVQLNKFTEVLPN